MHQSSSICSTATPLRPAAVHPTICVVDTTPGDYEAWRGEAAATGMKLQICGTAEEALRWGRTQRIDLWVVNTQLPGLSGFELCTMLKGRSSRTPVYLVADKYSEEAERAAWQARATLYGCKGTHTAWLKHWRLGCAGRDVPLAIACQT